MARVASIVTAVGVGTRVQIRRVASNATEVHEAGRGADIVRMLAVGASPGDVARASAAALV